MRYEFVAGVWNSSKGERGFHSVEVSKIEERWHRISDNCCYDISYKGINDHPKLLFYQRVD